MQFCKHSFILIDADEYAIRYMECHADEFPQANPQIVVPKVRRVIHQNLSEIKMMFESADRKKTGKVSFESFK